MTSEIKRLEFQLADDEFFGVGMKGRFEGYCAVVFEHAEEGGFAGVVETEEEDFGVFVIQTCVFCMSFDGRNEQ